MFLDASALIAILGREDDADQLISRIETGLTAPHCSPISVYETVLGLARKKRDSALGIHAPTPAAFIDQCEEATFGLLSEINATELPIGSAVTRAAVTAARDYGRATGHPAQLNFGDCFSYACARVHGLPLLYKGDDFSQTDIETA